ncbi:MULTISPECIES: alanine/glycine:cation symporter family protein [Vibrio]|jgi:AGCS family alanine or glycine:cation symporter|uniref:Sodium:alanine symporter family protein n=1 Tax=Vibrio diazotrophicus TaxID=685 RepID=A0A2J8I0W9_VIBDI|nr:MULTISPECIES: sodium:alanine symporter family protein [Vibrio]MCF7363848.1 sodium:alanine symporter family protein [Vibrio sp. A1-b2]MCZ4372629.1 sodium:alanine symporter family protein [Vibrio diazotrophicus]PNH93723.1 sodium:alanine symporter family protein [Vibrio diazotrophicus]PNI02237.1 sodium:alanine symporter family protein [Vibrio diazotrophicus]PNI04187.1 sodium:alanine symporter family protein [Vibrio diazotrophicus]
MTNLQSLLQSIDNFIWGPPLLILLVGTGIYFTFRLGLLQFRHLPTALKMVFSKDKNSNKEGDVSSFAALCTALSATIGTGNIVGVATAIKVGGPGALFWMWLAAVFGMATKYAECLLAVKYRKTDANGQMVGGPMYYLQYGVGSKALAVLFAIFALGVACFGIGTFPQVNAILDATQISFGVSREVTAVVLTLLVAFVTIGGIQSIAKVAGKVVPTMAVFYIVACLSVIITNSDQLLNAIELVLVSAFTSTAATGGFLGASIMLAIQSGIARGVFSNESGLGSAPMAAAAAKTDSCVRQGLISMTGTFFDTIIICTMTGLALILTGAWQTDLAGAAMTTHAFAVGLNANTLGPMLVSIGLMFFAFTTILGWNYYGERCVVYLLGTKAVLPYKLIFIALVASGAFLHLDMIWILADIVNGLMAIPNLIGLIALRHVVVEETKRYFEAHVTYSKAVA